MRRLGDRRFLSRTVICYSGRSLLAPCLFTSSVSMRSDSYAQNGTNGKSRQSALERLCSTQSKAAPRSLNLLRASRKVQKGKFKV